MKRAILLIIAIAAILLNSCSIQPPSHSLYNKYKSKIVKMTRNEIKPLTLEQQKVYARITFYHKHQDQFGDRIASNPKGRAQQGITVAAHPKFKFGTKVQIPALKPVLGDDSFVVQDRGSAVTSRKASKKKAYVFDVYVKARNKREGDKLIAQYARKLGMYTYVYIVN